MTAAATASATKPGSAPALTDRDALARRVIDSPIGPLALETSARGVRRIEFLDDAEPRESDAGVPPAALETLDLLERELATYFDGALDDFSVPLDEKGTPFQRAVWGRMRDVSPGETVSYAQIAEDVRKPGAARAVGQASGANPLPIVTPCHRVVASGGGLGGFGGGLDRKTWLLEHERGDDSP